MCVVLLWILKAQRLVHVRGRQIAIKSADITPPTI